MGADDSADLAPWIGAIDRNEAVEQFAHAGLYEEPAFARIAGYGRYPIGLRLRGGLTRSRLAPGTTAAAAICVRVVTANDLQGIHTTSLWIVVTADPEKAVQTVRSRVSSRCQVRATNYHVAPETIERAGLGPGQAHLL